ncbi:hypothetical protein D3C73_1165680 [compost metagenome]
MPQTFLFLNIGYLELSVFNRLQNMLYLFLIAKLQLLALIFIELGLKNRFSYFEFGCNTPVLLRNKVRNFILPIQNNLYSNRLNPSGRETLFHFLP